jgi:multiple sugar transport system substrate-binding protein
MNFQLPTNAKSRRWVLASGCAAIAAPALSAARVSHQEIADMVRDRFSEHDAPLRILLPVGSTTNVQPVADAFQNLTGVNVVLTEVSEDDVHVQLSLDHLTGQQNFDLALPATFTIPDLVEGGVISPFEGLRCFEDVTSTQSTSLFTIGDTFDDATYGFQTDGDAYVMFYNTDFQNNETERSAYADRFGMDLATPQTWEELDQQMAWFHRPGDGKFGGMLFRNPGYVAWEWWVRFHAKGVWPLSEDMTPQLANDAGVTALEDMIRVSEYLAPEAATAGLFENWERYEQGDIYANVGWGGSQKHFNKPGSRVRGKLTYGATPGGMIGDDLLVTPYFNWGWNYVVLSTSPEAELALHFAAFATSAQMSTLSVQQDGFFDPYRPEHYEDAKIRQAYSDDFLAVHRASMENAIPDLYLARQSDYFLSLSDWITRAINGSTSPENALARVEQQWNITTTSVGQAKQTDRWLSLRSKYPVAARRLLSDV